MVQGSLILQVNPQLRETYATTDIFFINESLDTTVRKILHTGKIFIYKIMNELLFIFHSHKHTRSTEILAASKRMPTDLLMRKRGSYT